MAAMVAVVVREVRSVVIAGTDGPTIQGVRHAGIHPRGWWRDEAVGGSVELGAGVRGTGAGIGEANGCRSRSRVSELELELESGTRLEPVL